MYKYLLGGALAAVALTAHAELANPDFATFDARPMGSVAYAEKNGPPLWRLASGSGQVITAAADALDGDSYFQFDTLANGFGSNKLDTCIAIDADREINLSYAVFAAHTNPAGLSVRLAPVFYGNQADCEAAIDNDSNANDLGDAGDLDVELGADQGDQWLVLGPDTRPELRIAASAIPEHSRFLRLSVRARDRADQIDPPAVLRLDGIMLTQEVSTENRVANGSFEHAERFADDFVAGGTGWYLDRDDAMQRAAIGPTDFALDGGNVIYLENLAGGYGDSRLDQCVLLDGNDVRPSASVYTLAPSADLAVRLNVAFHAASDCSDSSLGGGLGISDQDFGLDIPAGTWQHLVAADSRSGAPLVDAGATAALFSIRVRDRSGSGNNPDADQKIVFIGEASIGDAPPAPHFGPGAPGLFHTETEVQIIAPEGAQLIYTTDGSNPDLSQTPQAGPVTLTLTNSTQIRAAAVRVSDGEISAVRSATWTIVNPPPVPLVPSTGTSCTLSATPGATDPLLPALVLIALLWVAARRTDRSD